jgi:hypothetical protein
VRPDNQSIVRVEQRLHKSPVHDRLHFRTALRTSGARFFYEGEGVEARDGAVEGAADVGGDELSWMSPTRFDASD